MTTPTKTPSGGAPTKSEREWLRTFMRMIRVSPSLVREPDLIDRQVNEKYNLGLELDRPKDPTETRRVASKMFCSSVTPQRFAFFMRDGTSGRDARPSDRGTPCSRDISR